MAARNSIHFLVAQVPTRRSIDRSPLQKLSRPPRHIFASIEQSQPANLESGKGHSESLAYESREREDRQQPGRQLPFELITVSSGMSLRVGAAVRSSRLLSGEHVAEDGPGDSPCSTNLNARKLSRALRLVEHGESPG